MDGDGSVVSESALFSAAAESIQEEVAQGLGANHIVKLIDCGHGSEGVRVNCAGIAGRS